MTIRRQWRRTTKGKTVILPNRSGDEILYALIGGPSLYLLFVWLRSLWVAMPVNPAGLIDKLGRFARVGHFRDKLSFRHKFGGAFGEVCAALRMPGRPGLIIFIDDLDRCSAESVLAIFEAVNYFVSTGDCIVVMGFDRRQVEHSIGNELKDIADGVPNDEIPFHFDPENQVEKRRAYGAPVHGKTDQSGNSHSQTDP